MYILNRFIMLASITLYVCLYLFGSTSGSILTAPPISALIVAFENVYDASLLANTLSDQGIDTTLIISAHAANKLYNNLIDVEILQLNVNTDKAAHKKEAYAVNACDSLLRDQEVLKRMKELQPTFTIFPALRHDGCLLPWVRHIESIPVIWIGSPEEEVYAFQSTGVALPMHSGGIWTRLRARRVEDSLSSAARNNYLPPVLDLVAKYLPDIDTNMKHLYSDVRLVLWGADPVLRSNFASLTQLLVEVGCHHCRGAHPLLKDLQKSLVEHRLGTIVVLLDGNYETLVTELARKLPQGREGQSVVWRINKDNKNTESPENLFIHSDVDRQDLIGYSRTRVVLSHCADTEFLEAAFHGSPLICLPRDAHEVRNSERAVELGFAHTVEARINGQELAKTVLRIHETAAYRENARKVSLALRDRLNPASDRLVYWLGYVARTKNGGSERFLRPSSDARTFVEDSDFFAGIWLGLLFGIVACVVFMVLQRVIDAYQEERSKGRHML
ncbi:PREDICTED: UDP-glucuronosyltransferase 1-7C-like [Dinoponera quadriceps]|uniref:UDP-glucuronosyltransferase 1-7C-like n=1 Tax=Dinoponera quadriceps TaxID=609295 RepID=A0A6P3XUI8_DINQU|nr:PREDICTED: UDP-glucuronosyltransferase 1-7C-like [Dinoponera quadriceps]